MSSNNKAYKEAHKYFGLKKGDGLCLHHKDPTLKHTNPERYNEWLPADLCIMTIEEHNRLHHKGKKKGPMSEEHKKRIGEANKGKIPWNKGKNTTPVCQYTLAGEFVRVWESATQAEKEGGFNKGHITQVCRGKRPHHKGYIWMYVNNTEK